MNGDVHVEIKNLEVFVISL